MEAQGQRPLAPPPFATRGGYNGGNYLFLSLSLSLSRSNSAHALYNYFLQKYQQPYENLCPKSYIYIYDFRTIYTNVHI